MRRQQIIARPRRGCGTAGCRSAEGAGARAAAVARSRPGACGGLTEDTQAPPDPLLEADAPPLPGTSTRAFWIGLVVVSLSVVWALATFLILTNLTPIAPREEVVYVVLFVNLLLVVAMVAVIAVQTSALWRAWEKKVAGARLHARIVALFSLIAALPALLLAVAATTTFSRALDNWFNQQTMSIVRNSLDVAHAYLRRARPGHPHRHRQHGQGPRRGGAADCAATSASSAS